MVATGSRPGSKAGWRGKTVCLPTKGDLRHWAQSDLTEGWRQPAPAPKITFAVVELGRPAVNKALLPVLVCALLISTFPARAQDFPEGPGKETVTAVCGACHDINRIRVGYTPEGWRTVIRMMQNVSAPVPADQWAAVTEYLTKNFPERPRPAAVVVPGSTDAVSKEWAVPTPGSRPHDPLAAKDGAIWWSGQLANTLGRLDPSTGQLKEYVLKTPNTGPHGLTEDKDGNIWFTGNSAALIG